MHEFDYVYALGARLKVGQTNKSLYNYICSSRGIYVWLAFRPASML